MTAPALHVETVQRAGKVVAVRGTLVEVIGVALRVGDLCRFVSPGGATLMGEVVGLDGERALVMPLGPMAGLSTTTMVQALGHGLLIPPGEALLGRVVDGFCRPLDAQPLHAAAVRHVAGSIPSPLSRPLIDTPFVTGVTAIDALLTAGVGQRVGIFAPAGVGKTSLLGMIAGFSQVDAIVVALIGERGREVQEFMHTGLGAAARAKSIVVVATSDRPAAERIKAAHVAAALAEDLREQGRHVLLLFDSLTRFARALREVGLAAGEPPARRGFPPSVFAALPELVERAGRNEQGAITAFYTVLAEGPDGSDPVCEEARSLLDGHIVLSGDLAAENHFPAIDILASRSRVMTQVCQDGHLRQAARVRKWMAAYKKSELLIRLGEYREGVDAELDVAVRKQADIVALLQQGAADKHSLDWTLGELTSLSAHD